MGDTAHGNGSDNPESGGGSASGNGPQHVTTEQLNKAITGRMKALESKIEKAFEAQLDSKLGSILEQLKESQASQAKPGDAGDSGDGSPGVPPALAGQLKALKGRLTKLENENKDLNSKLADEKRQVSQERMGRKTLDALAKNDISGARGIHALGHLTKATDKVRIGADGEPVYFDGEYEVDLETGLAEWAKSEDAAMYRPPKPDRGSGERGGGVKLPQGNDLRSKVAQALNAAMQ